LTWRIPELKLSAWTIATMRRASHRDFVPPEQVLSPHPAAFPHIMFITLATLYGIPFLHGLLNGTQPYQIQTPIN
jgi:hypothetical protein